MRVRSLVLVASVLASTSARADDHPAPGVPPDRALKMLKEGNARAVAGKPLCHVPAVEDRQALASVQMPHTIVLSCSDSRVPPELVFDQGLGKLFVIRVAGNVLDPVAIASVEYAIEHLGARLVVVMGHQSCGAVRAALTTPRGRTAGSVSLDALVAIIRKNLERPPAMTSADRDDKLLQSAVRHNVGGVAAQLLAASPLVADRVASGQVAIQPGMYVMESGVVDFWSEPGPAKKAARDGR